MHEKIYEATDSTEHVFVCVEGVITPEVDVVFSTLKWLQLKSYLVSTTHIYRPL